MRKLFLPLPLVFLFVSYVNPVSADFIPNHIDPYDPITRPLNDPVKCENDFFDCLDAGVQSEECWIELVGCVEATITIFPERPNAPEPEIFEAPTVDEDS